MSHAAISAEQASTIVKGIFPGADLAACAPVPGEHRAQLYALTLSDGSEMVLKVYTLGDASPARREVHLLRTITAETGVPVPRLLGYGDRVPWEPATAEETRHWALLSRLPGTPLLQKMGQLEDAELEGVAYELGRYLAHLHQVPVELFGGLLEPGAHAHVREQAYVLSQAGEWLQECVDQGLLTRDGAAGLWDRFEQAAALDRQQPCLIHADLSTRQVIVEPGTSGHHVTGLVGWALSQGGSPEQDIAGLFAWDFHPQSAARKGVLDGYTESAALPPHFWQRLELYEVFVSLHALLTAHRKRDTRLQRLAAERVSTGGVVGGGAGNSEDAPCV